MKILSSSEKKNLLKQLKERFGIENLPYLLIRFGKEKIRGHSGNFSREELSLLDRELRIESAGLYLAKIQDNEIRLSLDATHILKNQINKNITTLNKKQSHEWFKGNDILLDKKITPGFKVLQYKDDFIGCGKVTQDGSIIKNFMPKERRVKN